ncbi:MAG: RsmF rRNA methyltransferase first C-terminal domain-containing protein [Anaerolineae bacterium]|nr:RsmF rRNA methyltransferase first C-terminal domain-containing protein [Anaerolineae bacterium]
MTNDNKPPSEFLAKMKRLLGAEYDNFAATFAQPSQVGLRVNTLKITPGDFNTMSPFALKPVGDYAPAGFLLDDASKPGGHPYHAAGLYYLQEPSAMAVAQLADPQPGEWVLDIAAAPGGKSTHLAALMQDTGLLVANDMDAKRASILAENMERWGTRHALITNAHPEQLAAQFGPVFDRVLVDAPCSGEGMFRRLGSAKDAKGAKVAWNQEQVVACARRQTAVLHTAATLVKPGGRLVYATCTFAPEENESSIARFLLTHPDFELIEPPRFAGFDRGRPSWADDGLPREGLEKCIRLWPHRFPGEGHFIAVMQHVDTKKPDRFAKPVRFQPPKSSELKVWREFARATLRGEWPEERMLLKNGRLYLLPPDAIETGRLKLVRYGLLLGEVRPGYFKPAHALALALKAEEVVTAVNFPADAPEIAAYLSGHPLPMSDVRSPMSDYRLLITDNWLLITVDGLPLGWAKASGGQLKNHYPRGLRIVKAEGRL